MKLLKLTLSVHDATTSGKEIYINPEHIVSVRPYTFSSGNYTEIGLANGEKFNVKETFNEIGGRKWL